MLTGVLQFHRLLSLTCEGQIMEHLGFVMKHLVLLLVTVYFASFYNHSSLIFVLIPNAARNYSRRRGKIYNHVHKSTLSFCLLKLLF